MTKESIIIALTIMIVALFVSQLILLNIKLFRIEQETSQQTLEIGRIRESVENTSHILESYDFEMP